MTNGSNTRKVVYLFIGDEGQLKERALEKLRGSILHGPTAQFNYNVFYGLDSSAKEILDCAATLPFLGPARVVVVKRADKLKEEERSLLINYASTPRPTTCLVLDVEDKSPFSALLKYQHVECVSLEKVPAAKLSYWIKTTLRTRGKSADDEAIAILKELFGNAEQGLLELEIEKLVSFVGKRTEVTAQDVEEVIGRGLAGSTYDLANAIARKDVEGALRILRNLAGVTTPRYSDIVGLLAWRLRSLLRYRLYLERGGSEASAEKSLRMPKGPRDAFLEQVKGLGADEIVSSLEALLRADLDMKTGRMDPKAALEAAVVRLCL